MTRRFDLASCRSRSGRVCPIDGRFSGITIAVNQRSKDDVDAVLAQAAAAGGTVLKPGERTE